MPTWFKWSYAGPIGGMVCVNWNEPTEPASNTWADNYLCSPEDHHLSWSSAGPLAEQSCLRIDPGNDSNTWYDNYLCQP